MRDAVAALLAPRSVALVGATDRVDSPGSRPVEYLRRSGWRGDIYPVNPRSGSVAGLPAYPDLTSLPVVPDHVFIMTATEQVGPVVAQCAELGVPVATVLAGGFGESGPDGSRRQQDLLRIASRGNVRLLGPNSIGVVNVRSGFTLTANAAFGQPLLSGTSFVASQSGSIIGALASRGRARHIGFAGLVSVGSEADLSVGEICRHTLDDPDVRSYVLFLESLNHADTLQEFALEAARLGKPVLAYKLGRSHAASDLVGTHTGALAGDDDVADAFFSECSIARVDTLEGLLEGSVLAPHLRVRRNPRSSRVGVLTATGGGAAMLVDQLGIRGIDVRFPSVALHTRLVDAVSFNFARSRVVDLTLRGTDVASMSAALQLMRASQEFDIVVQVLGSSAASAPELATAPALERIDRGAPLAVFMVPDASTALDTLTVNGVPTFRTPESCADALRALLSRRAPRENLPKVRSTPASTTHPSMIDEDSAYAVLDAAGVVTAARMTLPIDEHDSDAAPVRYPLVLKAVVPGLVHKKDAGAVAVGIDDDRQLTDALTDMKSVLAAGGYDLSEIAFVVQHEIVGVAEALVGLVRDAHVGPVVLLALGGIYTELSHARSLRLAPVDRATALAMIREVPPLAAIAGGYRGAAIADMEALASAIIAMSRLASVDDITAAETNPLIIGQHGAVAVDAVVWATSARVVATVREMVQD